MRECKKNTCTLSLIYPNTGTDIACNGECYFKDIGLNNKEKYIKQYQKQMIECGF